MSIPTQRPGQRVRAITLQVETLEGGMLRLSTPQARGWAAAVRTPHELARALELALREVACASYARAKGRTYDLDRLTEQVPGDPLAQRPIQRDRPSRQSLQDRGGDAPRTRRVKVHDPGAWSKFDDGRWRSPSGRVYRADTTAVRRMIARRVSLGLPI